MIVATSRLIPALLAAGIVTAALGPATADACSEQPPGVLLRDVEPTGATDVPTNTRVVVRYSILPWQRVPAALSLRADGGAAVALDVETVQEEYRTLLIATPRQPLAARTLYRLFDRVQLEEDCPSTGPDPCLGEALEVASFATGDGPDTTPPASRRATIESEYIAPGSDTCGPEPAVYHRAEIHDVRDDQPLETLRYNLYDPSGRRFRTLVKSVSFVHVCPPRLEHSDRFTVRVVDAAGNEGRVHELSGRTCESFEDDGGCSAGGSAGALVGLAALWLRRRPARSARTRGPA